jgi:hypothetical protein
VNKIAVALVLMAAAIILSSPIAFAQDESATNTEQEIRQKNVGSGESTNNNCALNSIDAGPVRRGSAALIDCPVTSGPDLNG